MPDRRRIIIRRQAGGGPLQLPRSSGTRWSSPDRSLVSSVNSVGSTITSLEGRWPGRRELTFPSSVAEFALPGVTVSSRGWPPDRACSGHALASRRIRSVEVGKLSRTVHRRSCAGSMFRPASKPRMSNSRRPHGRGGRARSRSSDARARARVWLVNSRGAPWRHTREGDVKDVWNRAGVEDVIHFARSLDERLPRAVRGGPALVADR
jgi:hypothetical protein